MTSPKVVLYKGNNDINALYTGKVGELTYNTNLNTVHVHDGTTTGGIKLVTLNPNNTIVSTNLVIGSTITTNNITTNIFTANSANVNSLTGGSINANSANVNSFTAGSINANSANVNSFTANTVSANSVSGNTANFTSVTVNNAPTSNTQLANKLYVDKKLRLAIAISGV